MASAANHHTPLTVPAASAKPPPTPQTAANIPRTPTLLTEVTARFRAALQTAYPDVQDVQPIVNPTKDKDARFGDYQCNNAMALFGKLKGKEGAPKAPRDVAQAIVGALPKEEGGGDSSSILITETSVAGPGFINVRVSSDLLAARVLRMLREGLAPFAPPIPCGSSNASTTSTPRVVVDFSSPNVAKEMHVGHLRSTIIGDTLCRCLAYCGADVARLNHIGDWGTQFGMLIQHMAETGDKGDGDGDDQQAVSDLMALYRAAKARFDAEDDFKERAREAVTRLQGGDEASLAAWRRICAASRKEFDAIYARLGVELTERGESHYNPMLAGVVDELREKGVAVESEGAMCVFVEGHENPLIVRKRDGGFGYASTDMAALKQRLTEEKADWIVYVTDAGQGGHFEQVFAAARKAGWLLEDDEALREGKPRVSHVGFGLVMGEDGKKFKTRSGDVVRLVELLDEAVARCKATIEERRAEQAANAAEGAAAAAATTDDDQNNVEEAARAMGYGAVKYADLKNSRMTNYKFSYDAMLDLRGNTAVYLLYAHARIAGIVRKSGADMAALASSADAKVSVEHPRERALALHLARFPDAVADVLDELGPNRLTDYVYDLSEAFSGFYTDCQVLGSGGETEQGRLLLTEATGIVMRKCLELLGIAPLYRI
jgi:arginyl-tRNA synthetase